MEQADTIAAVATPPGIGGIGVIRVSGPAAPAIARAVLGRAPRPRYAELAVFLDESGEALDEGIALYFPAPRSYTGEHVLELQGHGGPVILDLLLRRVLALGARTAGPGEFSLRAFLNGKLDLAQAEAVADLIESGSEAAARSALRSLQGAFSRRVRGLVARLIDLRTYVEAAIDFPEEEVDFLADGRILERLLAVRADAGALLTSAHQGRLLHEGMTLVLAGPPNAGKSSLLNVLAGADTAIVSPLPGTTRDVLREHIQIDGLPLHILDTAGLRDAADAIETEGVRRARAAMAGADRVLLVLDDGDASADPAALIAELPANAPYTLVRNKIDLSGRPPGVRELSPGVFEAAVSATTEAGLPALREHLKACMGFQPADAGSFSARRRHLDAIRRALGHLHAAEGQLRTVRAGELVAEELRLAQQALDEITGAFTADDLLGRIFSAFCIGK